MQQHVNEFRRRCGIPWWFLWFLMAEDGRRDRVWKLGEEGERGRKKRRR
jgi:hypothetical protein